jgi:NAD(P)-dependent dehydrogenase (short-subunit alcohol dehydrogenase family)
MDMTKSEAIRTALQSVDKHSGRVDRLINNTRRSYGASIEEIEPAIFDKIFHWNKLGPILAMQVVIPMMRKQGGGTIVNINSGTAFMVVPDYSVYSP